MYAEQHRDEWTPKDEEEEEEKSWEDVRVFVVHSDGTRCGIMETIIPDEAKGSSQW